MYGVQVKCWNKISKRLRSVARVKTVKYINMEKISADNLIDVAEKSRHYYKSKHWASKFAHADKKIGNSKNES